MRSTPPDLGEGDPHTGEMVGEVLLDRYELEELVGPLCMLSVYRAHDRLLDRTVASSKVSTSTICRTLSTSKRLLVEAWSAAANLSHPNIVTVIDRGEHDGRQFIVFEFVGGDNQRAHRAEQAAAGLATALELATQIASALLRASQRPRPP